MRAVSPERNQTGAVRSAWAASLRLIMLPVRYWNWKSALLSVAIRSAALFLFLAHTLAHRSSGSATLAVDSALHAALVEAAYVSVTAGIYAALQQAALRVEPRWLSDGLIVLAVPLGAQTVDYLVQHAAATPHMRAASFGMAAWSLLSATFHLHLMRNGAMLVGDEAGSLWRDMRRMPRLVALFVAGPALWVVRSLRVRAEVRAQMQTDSQREWA